MSTVYRPAASRVLAVAIFAICAIGLIAFAVQDGPGSVLRYGWWIALVGVLAWALFWNPRIVVDDSGVLLVNVFRTHPDPVAGDPGDRHEVVADPAHVLRQLWRVGRTRARPARHP